MTAIGQANILIVATDRFEELELFGPLEILRAKGANVTVASLSEDEIMGTVHDEPGRKVLPDLLVGEVSADDYDALILPGGVGNPDRLRSDPGTIALIKSFASAGKPVAAICHGPWLLVEADLLRGRTATSWPSIRTDLTNAGADWIDEEVVVDGNIITSRNPDDVPAFTDAVISLVERQTLAADA